MLKLRVEIVVIMNNEIMNAQKEGDIEGDGRNTIFDFRAYVYVYIYIYSIRNLQPDCL